MGEAVLSNAEVYEKVTMNKEQMKNYNLEYEATIKDEYDKRNINIDDYELLQLKDIDGIEPANAYILPKLQKLSETDVLNKKIPKGRPIISTCNSLYRKMDKFVADYMVPFVNKDFIPDFLRDTPHLLCIINEINDEYGGLLPLDSKIQTQDLEGMYPSFKVVMILDAWMRIWSEEIMTIPAHTLCRFLKLVLTHNLIEFNGSLRLQLDGLGQGLVSSPPASNGVMKFEIKRINE